MLAVAHANRRARMAEQLTAGRRHCARCYPPGGTIAALCAAEDEVMRLEAQRADCRVSREATMRRDALQAAYNREVVPLGAYESRQAEVLSLTSPLRPENEHLQYR
jgi:hypothetical protein